MIRAALIAVALAAPASAATVNDLTMTIIDGRPAFRPADGLDCWSAKLGGTVTDCALLDASTVRPRRAPCGVRDYPDRVCPRPVSRQVIAALPAVEIAPVRLQAGRVEWGGIGGTVFRDAPVVVVRHDPPPLPAVPLPWSGMMLATALAAGLILHKRRRMDG